MTSEPLDRQPGFRRRLRVMAGKGAVVAMVEDDMHCMAVTLHHDGTHVLMVEPDQHRAPWTTCKGAEAQLVRTFEGLPLAGVTARREKRANCTHLHDLAVLAAAHAGDRGETAWEIVVSDPVEGEREMAIRQDGGELHRWHERDGVLVSPAEIAGQTLFALRDWINALPEPRQEAARLLQWGAIVAHGRTIPYEQQSVATDMPPSCFTFQPEMAAKAVRVGRTHDFSRDGGEPLKEFAERTVARFRNRD